MIARNVGWDKFRLIDCHVGGSKARLPAGTPVGAGAFVMFSCRATEGVAVAVTVDSYFLKQTRGTKMPEKSQLLRLHLTRNQTIIPARVLLNVTNP